MTWLQLIAQGAIFATFIGVFIAISAYFNGKHIKEGVREIREMTGKIGEMIKGIGEMIKDMGEMIKDMDKRHEEGRRYMADLIVSEGEKTRELIGRVDNTMGRMESNFTRGMEENRKLMEKMNTTTMLILERKAA